MKLTKSTLAQLIKQQCDLDLPIDRIVNAKFQSYKIKLNKPITMRAMLNLDRSCPAPYYLPQKRQYVTLYAEKPAVVLQLLDGDLDSFST
jgi:hypothetical protein